MKRNAIEYFLTLLSYFISLLFIFLIWFMPENDDEWLYGVMIMQTIGIVLTITSGIFGKGESK